MSSYETLSIVLMILAIAVTLLIALIKKQKAAAPTKGCGYL